MGGIVVWKVKEKKGKLENQGQSLMSHLFLNLHISVYNDLLFIPQLEVWYLL